MTDLDEKPTTRLHYKAQTETPGVADSVRVAFWVGVADCEDSELRKVGEISGLTETEWLAISAFFRGDGKRVMWSAVEGGAWDWSKP